MARSWKNVSKLGRKCSLGVVWVRWGALLSKDDLAAWAQSVLDRCQWSEKRGIVGLVWQLDNKVTWQFQRELEQQRPWQRLERRLWTYMVQWHAHWGLLVPLPSPLHMQTACEKRRKKGVLTGTEHLQIPDQNHPKNMARRTRSLFRVGWQTCLLPREWGAEPSEKITRE